MALAAASLAAWAALSPGSAKSSDEYQWNIPATIPPPVVPDDNPMSLAKVELGRRLFYDERLSVNGQMSCATCHQQERAFTDGRVTAVGTTGQIHRRNSMSLTNVAYMPVLTWSNPTLERLEQQALIPLFGETPVEQGLSGQEDLVIELLRTDPVYSVGLPAAFPETAEPYSLGTLTRSLGAFQRSLLSFNSAYDRYRYGKDQSAISESAKRGESLFFSEELECHHCHGGLNFSSSIRHQRLAFAEIAFHNTALYNLDGRGAYPLADQGLIEITQKPEDMGRFRAPTLRNIALTAPYMHDGSVENLEDAISHYAAGGRRIASGPNAGIGRDSPIKDIFMVSFPITPAQRADLIEFLMSLTDETFVTDPRHSNPFTP